MRSSIAPLQAEARVSGPQVSQRLAGQVLTVLRREGDWRRVRGEDEYEGWVHHGYLDSCDARTADRLTKRPISLGCVVHAARGDLRRALPFGARLADDELIEEGEAVEALTLRVRFPRDPDAIAATAIRYFGGTPYQWGGVTPWGADCSGLVQSVFAMHGVPLPRDAWQQAERGTEVDGDIASLGVADLLFFSDRHDRRVTHVGIGLGASRMVHLALGRGGFAIDRFDEGDDPYVRQLRDWFLGARRVI